MKELDEKRKVILIKIGKALCNKREEDGHSISRIASTTKISANTLRAIEQAKYEDFPHWVFLRGFIRNYAKLLEIDSDWMVEGINQVFGEESPDITKSSGQEDGKYWGALLAITLSAVGLGTALYFFLNMNWHSNQLEGQTPISNSLVEEDASDNQITQALFKLRLDLDVVERGWARITLDNQPPFEVSLQPEERYNWQANDKVLLTLTKGNIANIFLNGEAQLIDSKDEALLYSLNLTD